MLNNLQYQCVSELILSRERSIRVGISLKLRGLAHMFAGRVISAALVFFAANVSATSIQDDFRHKVEHGETYEIAVLPMENFSVDPEVAHHFRVRLTEVARAKGYNTIAIEFIDGRLNELGLSHAEQLGLLPFDKLVAAIPADAYLSGVVEQAATQNALAFNGYVYTCSIKLQDQSGQVLWSVLEERVAKRRFALDPINALIDIALVSGDANRKHLAMQALADRMLASLPTGPRKVEIGSDWLGVAIETRAETQ